MEKAFNRIRTGLATLWIAIVSFFSKVMGQSFNQMNFMVEGMYWVKNPENLRLIEDNTLTNVITKITEKILVIIIFIVWIINLIMIIKTKNKEQRKKIIKRTIITISILLILIIACIVTARLLKKIYSNNDLF